MNILGKPGISLGSITYRRNYRACCSHKLIFFSSSSNAIAKRNGSRLQSGMEVDRKAEWKSIAKRTGSRLQSGMEVDCKADWKSIAKRTGSRLQRGLEVYPKGDWKSIAKRTGSLSQRGLEVYREAGWKSIASYYCFPDNIFDNSRVKTLKLSSFLL